MKKTFLHFEIDKELRDEFKKYCKKRGFVMSSRIQLLMREELKKDKKQ